MKYKITLSGLAGSRKSAVGKRIANRLNYQFISIGNYTRKFAREELNMNINEFQHKCKAEPNLDLYIDTKFANYCNSNKNLVIDYRLGFHFIKDALHVFLKVSENIAYKRIHKDNRPNEISSKIEIRNRNQTMRNRFKSLYNIDFTEQKNYDLVIDTNHLSLDEIVNILIKNIK